MSRNLQLKSTYAVRCGSFPPSSPPRCYIRVNCQCIGAIGQRKVTQPHRNPSEPVDQKRSIAISDFGLSCQEIQEASRGTAPGKRKSSNFPSSLALWDLWDKRRFLNQDNPGKAPHGKSGKPGTRLRQASATYRWQHISSSCPKWVGLRLRLGACAPKGVPCGKLQPGT